MLAEEEVTVILSLYEKTFIRAKLTKVFLVLYQLSYTILGRIVVGLEPTTTRLTYEVTLVVSL